MDSSRGVLLAERPSAINYMANHSVEAAQSVNFKGVMLSNRPDAGFDQSRHASFRIRGTEEKIHPAGRDTDYMTRMELLADRPRPPTLADGVKRGLEILAARKLALQHAAAVAEMYRLQRRARFTESQRQVREAIVSQAIIVEEEEDEPSGSASAAYTRISAPARAAEATGGGRKPAWARSAAAQEEEDEDEADELLAFVGGFNPDSYEGELEEKAGQALLAVQIAEVEAEEGRGKAELEVIEADEAGSALRAEAAAAARSRRDARLAARRAAAKENEGEEEDAGSEGGSEDEGEDIDAGPGELPHHTRARGDDAGSIADSALSSTSARAVHSKRSMAKVVQRTQKEERLRIAAAMAEGDTTLASSIALPVLVPPVVVEYNDMRGALEKKNGLVSLLPYQHRNPAV